MQIFIHVCTHMYVYMHAWSNVYRLFKGCFAHNRPGKSGCICIWCVYTGIVCKDIFIRAHIYTCIHIFRGVWLDSCYMYICVLSHILMSDIICVNATKSPVNESCHTYEWVTSSMWMSHVTHMKESCHTLWWVISSMWMSHVIYVSESCHL